tara:strand:+ start:636 stop:1229 length:594 start_codon:yes stop_codon:yes gene_type:complete
MPNYTTLADVKASLGIPSGSTGEDTYITASINAAEQEIDNYCGRTFVADGAASARVFQPYDGVKVLLDDFYTDTGLVVKTDTSNDGTYATTLTIDTDFIYNGNSAPFNILYNVSGAFPRYLNARPTVQVTAKWGYEAAVPAAVSQAALIMGARLFQRRSSPLGVMAGVVSEFGAVRVNKLDPDFRSLLAGFRRLGAA